MKEFIEAAIKKEIERRVDEALKDEADLLYERVQRRVRGEVGSIVATVMRRFECYSAADKLVIQVEFKDL